MFGSREREIIERLERIESLLHNLSGYGVRIVPRLGPILEQSGPSAPGTLCNYGPCHSPRILIMAFTMTDSQQVDCTLSFVDKKGNPATAPAGSIQWSTDAPAVVNLTPSGDGKTCTIVAAGPIGVANVTAKVLDGSGTSLAAGTIEVDITSGAPVSISITPGTASEQP